MKHKQKVKMARKMLSREEIKNHTSIFQSKAWDERVEAKRNKQLNQGKKNEKNR